MGMFLWPGWLLLACGLPDQPPPPAFRSHLCSKAVPAGPSGSWSTARADHSGVLCSRRSHDPEKDLTVPHSCRASACSRGPETPHGSPRSHFLSPGALQKSLESGVCQAGVRLHGHGPRGAGRKRSICLPPGPRAQEIAGGPREATHHPRHPRQTSTTAGHAAFLWPWLAGCSRPRSRGRRDTFAWRRGQVSLCGSASVMPDPSVSPARAWQMQGHGERETQRQRRRHGEKGRADPCSRVWGLRVPMMVCVSGGETSHPNRPEEALDGRQKRQRVFPFQGFPDQFPIPGVLPGLKATPSPLAPQPWPSSLPLWHLSRRP